MAMPCHERLLFSILCQANRGWKGLFTELQWLCGVWFVGYRIPSPFLTAVGNLNVLEPWVSWVPEKHGELVFSLQVRQTKQLGSEILWQSQHHRGLSHQVSVQVFTRHHGHQLPGQPALYWEGFFWGRKKQGPLGTGIIYAGTGLSTFHSGILSQHDLVNPNEGLPVSICLSFFLLLLLLTWD